MFCKDTYIIAEIQSVGNPERPLKLQNSSAKVSRNSRKTFAEEKKQNLLGFWGLFFLSQNDILKGESFFKIGNILF